jgi:hypothetical protein
MAIYYQTEYRMGRRGRVCRYYTGLQALVAIFFDLTFGLAFELISIAIRLMSRLFLTAVKLGVELLRGSWKILVAAVTVLVYLATLPFALLNQWAGWLRTRLRTSHHNAVGGPSAKPEWALGREL